MEGLKLIAQSTFDKHQKFRPASDGGPYRYNVIEIGAFAGTPATSSSSSSKPNGTTTSSAAGAGSSSTSRPSGGTPSRVTLNEWMVYEDDLGAFMKKRPVHVASTPASTSTNAEQQRSGTATTSSTGLSRSGSSKLAESGTSTATNNTTATTATAGSGAGPAPGLRRINTSGKEETEAVASLKLVCVQRATDLESPHTNALAISRETFLRLYVDYMDADHYALYYLAREYDGFHEFNDSAKGVATKFLGTSDYALVWTFNRRTLETRGLFLDRCQRWQAKDTGHGPVDTPAPAPGSAPVTPMTPSRKWTQNKSGTVTASEAWQVFRDTLHTYRTYVFAPQLLSFTACVHMLRTYDDQVNGDDLPLLRDAETSLAAAHEAYLLASSAVAAGTTTADIPGAEVENNINNTTHSVAGSGLLPSQMSSFVIAPDRNPFAPSTPPSEAEKMFSHHHHQANNTSNRPATTQPTPLPFAIPLTPAQPDPHRRLSHALACTRADASLSNKLRHLGTARNTLEALKREHETVIADVVAPEFLDRYHRSMEGMVEAVPALERHLASLDEYLRYLKGRSERLGATLVRQHHHNHKLHLQNLQLLQHQHHQAMLMRSASSSHESFSSSRATRQSDSSGLRYNEADTSRPGQVPLRRPPLARTYPTTSTTTTTSVDNHGGAVSGLGISSTSTSTTTLRDARATDDDHHKQKTKTKPKPQPQPSDPREAYRRGRNPSFYASYLLLGNYSHRLR